MPSPHVKIRALWLVCNINPFRLLLNITSRKSIFVWFGLTLNSSSPRGVSGSL